MAKEQKYPCKVFTSLSELLKLEGQANGFSLLARKQKIKSILSGKHASKLRGRGLDFEEVRNYVAGDDIRNIDWKVTARTKKTHTRVFTEEKEKPTLIVVDQSNSMFFGSRDKTKSTFACELAALAAFRIQKQGDRVGGLIFSNDSSELIKPRRDRKNIMHFFDKLVYYNRSLIKPSEQRIEDYLTEILARVERAVTHDFLVVVVSDFARYDERTMKSIVRIARHNNVILAKVFDPLEKDIPNMNWMAGDQEKQILVRGKDNRIQEKFKKGIDEDLNQFENNMVKHGITLLKFDCSKAINEQLKSVFASST